jgi:hypothetical protein
MEVAMFTAFLILMLATSASAQTYTHQIDPAQYEGAFRAPNPELSLDGQPLSILHEKWQYVSGVNPAAHRGPVTNFIGLGPCDGTPWTEPEDWSHYHKENDPSLDCDGPCTVVEERMFKCPTPGNYPWRDAFVYIQPDDLPASLKAMRYGVTQFGPDDATFPPPGEQSDTLHSGPILRELLVHNAGGKVVVWGHPDNGHPTKARIRVTVWDWNGYHRVLLDSQLAPGPVMPFHVHWPEGFDAQFIMLDGTVEASRWFMGDLQMNALDVPGCGRAHDSNNDGVVGGPDFAQFLSEFQCHAGQP